MLTTVVWVTPPLVADRVTAYVPGVVRSDAEIVSVTVPEPSADKARFDAFKDAVGSEGESPAVTLVGVTLAARSEEHTSELQSQSNLVCRLLLEKKNNHK